MAKYRAVQGFSGIATMKKDEVRDFDPREVWVQDLIKFGFIEPVKVTKKEAPAEEPKAKDKPKKKATRSKAKKEAKE